MVGFEAGVRVGYLRIDADAAERALLEAAAPIIACVIEMSCPGSVCQSRGNEVMSLSYQIYKGLMTDVVSRNPIGAVFYQIGTVSL